MSDHETTQTRYISNPVQPSEMRFTTLMLAMICLTAIICTAIANASPVVTYDSTHVTCIEAMTYDGVERCTIMQYDGEIFETKYAPTFDIQ